jgi:tetratricopeptide (TPR) repeat protein
LYPLDINGPAIWKAGVCLLLLVLVSGAAFMLRRRSGYLFTGWFWYLGTLVPVIGLVQAGAQGMADRYMYFPGIGIYIIIAWLAGDMAARLRVPRIITAAAGVSALAVLLLISSIQTVYWENSIMLCQRAIAVTQDNFRMHTNLGHALLEKGYPEEAAAEFKKALQIRPDDAIAMNYYGVVLANKGLYDEAIEQFDKALSVMPDYSEALHNLCNTGIKSGKLGIVLEILRSLEQKTPDSAELLYDEGIIYKVQGNDKKCIEMLEKALEKANSQGKKELAVQIQEQLELCRQAGQGK